MLLDFPYAVENVRRIKEEYRNEGLSEGRAEGRAEGRVEGRSEKELEVVRNLLCSEQPLEMIALALGKSVEEVESIIKGLQETENRDEGKS